jgi:hypothetical protein
MKIMMKNIMNNHVTNKMMQIIEQMKTTQAFKEF